MGSITGQDVGMVLRREVRGETWNYQSILCNTNTPRVSVVLPPFFVISHGFCEIITINRGKIPRDKAEILTMGLSTCCVSGVKRQQ